MALDSDNLPGLAAEKRLARLLLFRHVQWAFLNQVCIVGVLCIENLGEDRGQTRGDAQSPISCVVQVLSEKQQNAFKLRLVDGSTNVGRNQGTTRTLVG